MDGPTDFAALQSAISSALVAATRTTSQLASEDLNFHRSLDSSFATSLDAQNARFLSLAERLLGTATANSEIVRPPRLTDVEAVETNWRQVVDVVDSLLERADIALDEFTGAVKRLSPGASAGVDSHAGKVAPRGSRIAAALQSQNIEKPQLLFENVPTNREKDFRPLLKSKPHAIVPFEEGAIAQHPYQKEIEDYVYPSTLYTEAEPTMYHPFETTTATFVDNEEAMYEMLEELRTATEIAVDLEHHDQRSYIGIVSLMQISTRDKDWIVDTLKPWRRKLSCLNEVFADPGIIKVLHGAFMDIVWLQRDLGLYVVGLFDTHYASRALGYAGGSLAFLLDKFANVQAQKQYQTADWRIRPLPQELFDYARSDTHYLLYIFDCMRNELIQKSDFSIPDHENDKIWDVLRRSNETALQRYEHPVYDTQFGQGPSGWYKMFSRTSLSLSKEEFSVLRAIHRWRDETAREQDDSVHYIMANHQIIALARAMPTSRTDLFSALSPCSVTVRLRADELVTVIAKAKAEGKSGPEMTDVLNEVEAKFPRKHWYSQPAVHAVASTVQQLKEENIAFQSLPSSTLPLRSPTSTFWGPAFGSSVHQTRDVSTLRAVTLAVPLPPLTAEIFADDAGSLSPPSTTNPSIEDFTPASQTAETLENSDDVFVLKEMNRKRKRAAAAPEPMPVDNLATQSDVIALPDEETERLQAKAQRKQARKEAKKAKAALKSDALANGDEDDEQPFDYEAAPSILNPPRESREEMRERRKKEKNPWAKSMDAPKGLPRTQKESAGRSHTFKS
nr:exosome complex exonuclease rrp6 [Quercus suber]